jgi:hypothetical protein
MRSILWYLAFVGMPLVALLGILRLGQQLRPPVAVHGRYAIQFDSSGAGPCVSALADSGEQRLTVSQSGPRLEMAFGRVALGGTITGDSVQATVRIDTSATLRAARCLTADTLRLVAAVERTGQDTRLPGRLLFPGCESCAPVAFRATRLAEQSRGPG